MTASSQERSFSVSYFKPTKANPGNSVVSYQVIPGAPTTFMATSILSSILGINNLVKMGGPA